MTDNYKSVTEIWQKKALSFDWKKTYQQLGLWGYSATGDLKIRFFGREYGIRRDTAEIYDILDPEREINFCTAMGIYHIFYYALPDAKASGEWVPLREIRRAAPFERAFFNNTLEPFAKACDGKLAELTAAGETLGFRKLTKGDIGFEADIYDCMKIRLLFWDGDEEFPAQANILFDSNSNDFLHEESVIMMGMELCERLLAEVERR